jgi:hypothetical protein
MVSLEIHLNCLVQDSGRSNEELHDIPHFGTPISPQGVYPVDLLNESKD